MRQYSAEEAARLSGRPARAIRQWIKLGQLRAARYGREYVIAEADLPTAGRRRPRGPRGLVRERAVA